MPKVKYYLFIFYPGTKKPLPQKWFLQQGYKDSNLELTESESVALPFGDSPKFSFAMRFSLATSGII